VNKTQALKKAAARWGKNAAVRDEGRPTAESTRQAASAQLPELRERLQAATTPAERKERRAELDEVLGLALRYRYSVGYVGGIAGFGFFSVQGQGDTWEEACQRAGLK
jgi:type VI protein secretion system component VasF